MSTRRGLRDISSILLVLGLLVPLPSQAHLTDPEGCELLLVKSPDRQQALTAGLSDDRVTLNYGFDMNQDGRVDLIIGYQVLPQVQGSGLRILPTPSIYWLDTDKDGAMDQMFVPLGASQDCRYYLHMLWDGEKWILLSQHPDTKTPALPRP